MKQEKLFNDNDLELSLNDKNYKRKWTNAFIRWCKKNYDPCKTYFHCNCMFICYDCIGHKPCKWCVRTIKKSFYIRYRKIPYGNYNFEKLFQETEKIAKRNEELDDKFYRTIWKKLGVEE